MALPSLFPRCFRVEPAALFPVSYFYRRRPHRMSEWSIGSMPEKHVSNAKDGGKGGGGGNKGGGGAGGGGSKSGGGGKQGPIWPSKKEGKPSGPGRDTNPQKK